jgi:hypothetical protein
MINLATRTISDTSELINISLRNMRLSYFIVEIKKFEKDFVSIIPYIIAILIINMKFIAELFNFGLSIIKHI